MNHIRHPLKTLEVEGHQIEEAVRAIMHTILFLRAKPKYTYKGPGSYSIGTVGYEDVDCDCIDLTYTRMPSRKLQDKVHANISKFCDAMRGRQEICNMGETVTGTITLQFYQRNKATWTLGDDTVPWEDWLVSVNLVTRNTERGRQTMLERLSDDMREIIFTIIQITNNDDFYTPKDPKQEDMDSVFDTSFEEFQSYLFKMQASVNDVPLEETGIVGATVRKISQALS
ncbi:autophagy-related protein 101-like [Watersipora subatra]|uniref:autophagy-related protein 101-like n=1 Tax=Watersipora subatra TaxID=2589382 RepID=UPI00355C22F1